MTQHLRQLYAHIYALPFPDYGKAVGDFGFYDGLIMGTAHSVIEGFRPEAKDIPEPDAESAACFGKLRKKRKRTTAEQTFVDYYALLEELRQCIIADSMPGHRLRSARATRDD